ncbi:MAG: GTP cyclohydrolase MptA [Desulfurococcales archaeon]|nr:GTP cyclohydrolase MptA [Desulfurococcales archaeon]
MDGGGGSRSPREARPRVSSGGSGALNKQVEVQDQKPELGLRVDRVGFRGVKRRIRVRSPKGLIYLDLDMDVLVDIGSDRRGAHLSRNIEAIRESLEPPVEAGSIEEYLDNIASNLLSKHSYATRAEVKARTRYYVNVEYKGLRGEEPVDVEVTVTKTRSSNSWSVSVTARGMSVCPSAQHTISEILSTQPPYSPSHSQKVELRGTVTTSGRIARIEKIAKALYRSFSAPSITLLKRSEEARLIIEAFRNPLFVEDIVRRAIAEITREFMDKLPADAIIEVEARSLESIHPHDVYAYSKYKLSEAVNALGEV